MISLLLTDQECSDILCTALEGGSCYWANEDYDGRFDVVLGVSNDPDFPKSLNYAGLILNEKRHSTYRASDEYKQVVRHCIGLGDIREAADAILGTELTGSHIRADIAANRGGCDAQAADAILQVALFGKLIYG